MADSSGETEEPQASRQGDATDLFDQVRTHARLVDAVESRGIKLTKRGKGLVGLCPFHDDETPSFHVNPSDNVWNCSPCAAHGGTRKGDGDSIGFVAKRDGVSPLEAAKRIATEQGIVWGPLPPAPMHLVATYPYMDMCGVVLATKERREHVPRRGKEKQISWRSVAGSKRPEGWAPLIYRLPDVITAISERLPILVPEGEKCVDVLAELGFVATCNEDGAGTWKSEHAEHLRGARVVILPDNDAAGIAHAKTIEASLAGVAASVWCVALPGLKAKGDVADWLKAGGTREALEAIVQDAVFDGEIALAKTDLDAIGADDEARPARRLFSTTGADLLDMEFPETPWLLQGLLVKNGNQALSAEAKGTKTWIAMEYAFAIASGTPAFGYFPTCIPPSHVGLFQAEDQQRASKAKFRALAASRGMCRAEMVEVGKRLHFENLTKLNVRNKTHAAEVVAAARGFPERPALIVLDPLVKVHNANEDKASEMETVTAAINSIGRCVGCATLFAHHNSKATDGTGKRRGGQRMRGSGSLHGAVDGGLYLEAPTGDRQTEWIVKANAEIKGARSAGDFTLTLRILEDDAHGEALRVSWTVEKGMQSAAKASGKAKKKEATPENALAILREEYEVSARVGRDPRPTSSSEIATRLDTSKSTAAGLLRTLYDARPPLAFGTQTGGVYINHQEQDDPEYD